MTTGDATPPDRPITWHTAFRDAIQLVLYPYREALQFEFEHPLNSEPLRIDVVIIKKRPGLVIDQPLGAIFKGVNIIEYKGPGDYLSVQDYHKVGAYLRLYSVLNGVDPRDMTVTLVGERYPEKLLNHVREVYGYEVEERWPGIYYVKGDIAGVQIIRTRGLSGEGEQWLRDLRGGLKGEELREILEKSRGMSKEWPLSAYVYMILEANDAGVREMAAMSDTVLEQVLEECGYIAKWEARGLEQGRERGLEQGREEAVKRLQKHGMDPTEIAEALELPLDTVRGYLDAE